MTGSRSAPAGLVIRRLRGRRWLSKVRTKFALNHNAIRTLQVDTMADVGADMNKPTWLSSNINLGNILTLVVMLGSLTYGYGKLENRIDNMEVYRSERTKATDLKFEAISRSLEGLPNLSYRVTANEEALKATNARLDASLQTISARVAEMNQLLGSLDTKIAVLTQRLELTSQERRADAAKRRPD